MLAHTRIVIRCRRASKESSHLSDFTDRTCTYRQKVWHIVQIARSLHTANSQGSQHLPVYEMWHAAHYSFSAITHFTVDESFFFSDVILFTVDKPSTRSHWSACHYVPNWPYFSHRCTLTEYQNPAQSHRIVPRKLDPCCAAYLPARIPSNCRQFTAENLRFLSLHQSASFSPFKWCMPESCSDPLVCTQETAAIKIMQLLSLPQLFTAILFFSVTGICTAAS